MLHPAANGAGRANARARMTRAGHRAGGAENAGYARWRANQNMLKHWTYIYRIRAAFGDEPFSPKTGRPTGTPQFEQAHPVAWQNPGLDNPCPDEVMTGSQEVPASNRRRRVQTLSSDTTVVGKVGARHAKRGSDFTCIELPRLCSKFQKIKIQKIGNCRLLGRVRLGSAPTKCM